VRFTTTNVVDSGGYYDSRTGSVASVVPGQTYYVSMMVYAPANAVGKQMRLSMVWYNSVPTFLSSTPVGLTTLQPGWNKLVGHVTNPEATGVIGLLACYTPSAEGVFDVYLTDSIITPEDPQERFQSTDGAQIVGGTVLSTPWLLFPGYMNGGWDIREAQDRGTGTVEITGTIVSRMANMTQPRGIRTNWESHRGFYGNDRFFEFTATLANQTFRWGQELGSLGLAIQRNGLGDPFGKPSGSIPFWRP
jgi:hypothetical protein